MTENRLIACHDCDALLRKPPLRNRQVARCPRCGATLYRGAATKLDRLAALALGALITFAIAQSFPVIELDANGLTSQTSLLGALVVLWGQDMQIVAAIVFCSTFLFPLTELLALLYVLLPVRRAHVPPGVHHVLRVIQFVRPWGMLEVFLLGTLVTVVKMTDLARVIPETALFAFGALTLMLTVVATFDARTLWDIVDELRAQKENGAGNAREIAPGAPTTPVMPTAAIVSAASAASGTFAASAGLPAVETSGSAADAAARSETPRAQENTAGNTAPGATRAAAAPGNTGAIAPRHPSS